jgi:predicted ferric reductase
MRFKVQKQKDIHLSQDKQPCPLTPNLKTKRPFTFTSLNDDYLEFIIKIYDSNDGVTRELGELKQGDELLIHDVWGAIEYKGEGVFIAGGAGVTRSLQFLGNYKLKTKSLTTN